MAARQYLDEILGILSLVKEDREKLGRILHFLESDILPGVVEEDVVVIPKKFEAVVNTIAQSMTSGMVCYLNMNSAEVEEMPAEMEDEELWEAITGEKAPPLKHTAWENALFFKPFESFESFRIMADFAGQVADQGMRNRLTDILNRKKPFAHFNQFIHNSPVREDWFAFRDAAYEQHVRQMIYDHLDKK